MAALLNDVSIDVDDSDFDMSFMSDGEENVAPPKKGSKPASKSSKGKKPNPMLSPRSASATNIASATSDNKGVAKKKKTKTIEETYQKKTQLEHILLRPDTYIGSTEPLSDEMYIYDEDQDAIVSKNITYTPGLYKIFDESKCM
jgi:DNA topoisomerase-2